MYGSLTFVFRRKTNKHVYVKKVDNSFIIMDTSKYMSIILLLYSKHYSIIGYELDPEYYMYVWAS